MAGFQQHSWQALAFVSALSFALAIFLSMNLDPRSGIPRESDLLEASGGVAWLRQGKYGTRFGLAGVERQFTYSSKSNGMDVVSSALRGADGSSVSVRYEAEAFGPLFSDQRYHRVWELKVGGRIIRSHAESAAAWESDNRLTPWLAAVMTLSGLYLGFTAWRLRRQEAA